MNCSAVLKCDQSVPISATKPSAVSVSTPAGSATARRAGPTGRRCGRVKVALERFDAVVDEVQRVQVRLEGLLSMA